MLSGGAGDRAGGPADAQAEFDAVSQPLNVATNLYTTGQYFGVLWCCCWRRSS